MSATNGPPSFSDILLAFDAWGSCLKASYAALGLNAPTETTTLAALAGIANKKLMGDGTTTYPGLSNTLLQSGIARESARAPILSRYDVTMAQLFANQARVFDQTILQNLPTGISFSDPLGRRPLDLYLLRANGLHALTPPKPTGTPTLTVTTGGRIPTGVGRRYKYAWVYQDAGSVNRRWHESQLSAAATLVAMSGSNSAYTIGAIQNPVPANVGAIAVYGQLIGSGTNDPYYWEKDVPCTPSAAPPAVTGKAADIELNQSWLPVSWLQALLLPEDAFIAALSQGSLNVDSGIIGLIVLGASALLSAENVALNPVSGFLGEGNAAADGMFAQWVATAFTEGTILRTSDYTTARQGFAGAANGVQLRVTATLSANAPITNVTYYYYDATNPTAIQNTTIAAPGTLNLAVGQTLDLAIPAGRLVTRVSAMTVGTATTGTIIAEALPLRSI